MDKITRALLKLAVNPHATVDQLMAGIELMDRRAEEDLARRAAMPPQPVKTPEERAAELRRSANQNLARLRKGR